MTHLNNRNSALAPGNKASEVGDGFRATQPTNGFDSWQSSARQMETSLWHKTEHGRVGAHVRSLPNLYWVSNQAPACDLKPVKFDGVEPRSTEALLSNFRMRSLWAMLAIATPSRAVKMGANLGDR